MRLGTQLSAAATVLLALAFLAGCGHASTTKNNSKSASSTSKDEGKVYTSDSKGSPGGQGAGATSGGSGTQSGGGNNAALPSPANTVNNKPSVASDVGSTEAIKGQAVMNPGAPTAHTPQKH